MENEVRSQVEHQFHVYESSQAMIPLADAKAGAIIAANIGLIATIVNAPFIIEKFSKIVSMPSPPGHIIMVFLAFAVFSLISIATGVMVLYPRPSFHDSKLKPPKLTFFGDIYKYQNAERYLSHVKELDDGVILQEMCAQNFEVAKILHQKYRISKVALTTFIFSLGAWVFFIYAVFKFQM